MGFSQEASQVGLETHPRAVRHIVEMNEEFLGDLKSQIAEPWGQDLDR